MPQIGVVRDNRFLNHIPDPSNPESPLRLKRIHSMLDAPDMNGRFQFLTPRIAEKSEILLNHTPEYFQRIADTAGQRFSYLTADTQASAGSFESAMLSAGGLLLAIEKVTKGELNQAFSLNRPPGHHAEKSRAMGFCIFNNIALGAHFARKILGLKRVLILDWDVHHGNGTQHAFENDPSVLFFSIHQYPHYPGTGHFTDVGWGKGEGYTLNLPLPRGYGDAEYTAILECLLRPVAMEFSPELILVSAGFDIHVADPLGGMRVTPSGFAAMTRSVIDIAETCCGGRVVFALEGGYNLDALAESMKALFNELAGKSVSSTEAVASRADTRRLEYAVARSRHVHGQFWKSLKG
jgi:acetoin utilization deacetylase AcuC-like enzyme